MGFVYDFLKPSASLLRRGFPWQSKDADALASSEMREAAVICSAGEGRRGGEGKRNEEEKASARFVAKHGVQPGGAYGHAARPGETKLNEHGGHSFQ